MELDTRLSSEGDSQIYIGTSILILPLFFLLIKNKLFFHTSSNDDPENKYDPNNYDYNGIPIDTGIDSKSTTELDSFLLNNLGSNIQVFHGLLSDCKTQHAVLKLINQQYSTSGIKVNENSYAVSHPSNDSVWIGVGNVAPLHNIDLVLHNSLSNGSREGRVRIADIERISMSDHNCVHFTNGGIYSGSTILGYLNDQIHCRTYVASFTIHHDNYSYLGSNWPMGLAVNRYQQKESFNANEIALVRKNIGINKFLFVGDGDIMIIDVLKNRMFIPRIKTAEGSHLLPVGWENNIGSIYYFDSQNQYLDNHATQLITIDDSLYNSQNIVNGVNYPLFSEVHDMYMISSSRQFKIYSIGV